MKDLVSHIEFLLHHHNCVIIPDFGGFVVNSIHSERDGVATFHAPSCELVFNRDLTHNDGLLAQSYMKTDQLSFEAAMVKIEQAVNELKRQLRGEHRVDLGELGYFAMNDEKRFVYKPAAFVQPAFYGLERASLKPLIQMQPVGKVARASQRKPSYRMSGINVAAAAAVLILLLFLLPVGDRTMVRHSAQMLSESDIFGGREWQNRNKTTEKKPTVNNDNAEEILLAEQSSSMLGMPEMIDATLISEPRYYIVVGVYEVQEVAEQMMENLLSAGLTDRGWMKRGRRIDVYAASFAEKSDAMQSLKEIHKNYPNFRDAWILKR